MKPADQDPHDESILIINNEITQLEWLEIRSFKQHIKYSVSVHLLGQIYSKTSKYLLIRN